MKTNAEHAVEIAVDAAQLAIRASKSAAKHAAALKPDPRQGILGDLARQE